MPRIFKPLASIVAWILFVLGCIGVVHFYVTAAMGEPIYVCMALTIACFILSVCAMKLRKMLE
jgi:hypothetical protein